MASPESSEDSGPGAAGVQLAAGAAAGAGGYWGGSAMSYNAGEGAASVREQDRFLPIANVSRIMKKALPGNAKISKEAKETVQECVSEFISFVTGEASDKCQREKRKTINGDDLLWAISTLGFEDYVDPLKLYLSKFREVEGERALINNTNSIANLNSPSNLSANLNLNANLNPPPTLSTNLINNNNATLPSDPSSSPSPTFLSFSHLTLPVLPKWCPSGWPRRLPHHLPSSPSSRPHAPLPPPIGSSNGHATPYTIVFPTCCSF
ncbi:hypothetical protein L7F22_030553 [Adiantum nelumboides]|nr:hypothetical protein [Adiantum nelumboides]